MLVLLCLCWALGTSLCLLSVGALDYGYFNSVVVCLCVASHITCLNVWLYLLFVCNLCIVGTIFSSLIFQVLTCIFPS